VHDERVCDSALPPACHDARDHRNVEHESQSCRNEQKQRFVDALGNTITMMLRSRTPVRVNAGRSSRNFFTRHHNVTGVHDSRTWSSWQPPASTLQSVFDHLGLYVIGNKMATLFIIRRTSAVNNSMRKSRNFDPQSVCNCIGSFTIYPKDRTYPQNPK